MRKSRITTDERILLDTQPSRRAVVKVVEPAPVPRKSRKTPEKHPGYDGNFEPGSRIVDDPYEPGAKITVPANVKADPLIRMLSRNEIDEAQFKAGEKFRALLEQVGGAGAPCADWTRPFVDKSFSFKEPASAQFKAALELKQAWAVLGWQNYRLVHGVIIDGLNGSLITQARGEGSRETVMQSVRDGLEQLAILWGYLSDAEHVNKRASMVAYLNEIPTWEHAEKEIQIEYAEPERKRA